MGFELNDRRGICNLFRFPWFFKHFWTVLRNMCVGCFLLWKMLLSVCFVITQNVMLCFVVCCCFMLFLLNLCCVCLLEFYFICLLFDAMYGFDAFAIISEWFYLRVVFFALFAFLICFCICWVLCALLLFLSLCYCFCVS